jgi:uncharacterized Zn finger protein (UPF0148 family)
MEDWESKVSDGQVYCPMCGYTAPADQWLTHEHNKAIEEIALSHTEEFISNMLDEMFREFEGNMRGNKYVQIEYKPGQRTTFLNNPIGQRPEWELEITCEKCQTRYSVIGSAYFCPCCGHNAIERVFNESLDRVQTMIDSIADIYNMLETSQGIDKAESMCRSIIEGTLGDIVSAFQKYAEDIYKRLMPTQKVRVNDFQIIDKGSKLFSEAIGKGYDSWLTDEEINDMNILFQQRHLIEHNNGLIDERYIQNSNDSSYKIGQRVIVGNSDALRLLGHVRKLSSGLREQTGIK